MRLRRSIMATVFALSILVVSGCSIYKTHVRDAKITAAAITEECDETVDFHFIPPGMFSDVPYRIVLTRACLGVDQLLVVTWPGERNEIRETFSHYLALLYTDSRSNSEKRRLSPVLIKRDELTPDPDVTTVSVWFSVYELTQNNEKK